MNSHYRILIIGAGFGGLGMAIQLKQRGENDFLILEKGADVGGCWRDNTYPGAACDVPSHLYSYSFERHYPWSRRFAPQAEILDYQQYCARKYDLYAHLQCNTEVVSATYQDDSGHWLLTLQGGEQVTCQSLITATGQLNRPLIPALPGLDKFSGPCFHSARWDHDADLSGKRIATIGTGASAIQFVPHLAEQASQLTLFQRSAAHVLPKPDRPYRAFEHAVMKRLPASQTLDRARIYAANETRALAFSSFHQVMKVFDLRFRHYLKQQISDPELRAKLIPDYPMGCKRILMSNDYFPALARDNVNVVSHGIQAVTETGVVDSTGKHHDVDAIVFGTGFRATEFLSPMRITGRNGKTLNDTWQEGAQAYLGITVSGFPNLYMMYGPNTNLGHNSIIYMLECQMHYIAQCLDKMHHDGLRSLEVLADAESDFNTRIQKQIRHTVWDKGCDSWYKTSSGKNTNNWPGFTFHYRRQTRQINWSHYALAH